MKLLILSRAPYDGDRTKTCSNDWTVDTQTTGVVKSKIPENSQHQNQILPSHKNGFTDITSSRSSMINHSTTESVKANDSRNTQSYHTMYPTMRPTAFTASDTLPLDLSGFKKTSSSSQRCDTDCCGTSESPLDLSVKTRENIAYSTDSNSVENVTVSRSFPSVNKLYQTVPPSEVNRNDNILYKTQIDESIGNKVSNVNGFQRNPHSNLVKADYKKGISNCHAEYRPNSASDTTVLSSLGRSDGKQTFHNQQPNCMIGHRLNGEVSHGSVDRTDDPEKRSALQNRSFSDRHSLQVSPHPVLTPSPSLPSSHHSASTSPYLVPSSPRGIFAVPTSPGSYVSYQTRVSNRMSVLHDAGSRTRELDYDRSHLIPSNMTVMKPSASYQVNTSALDKHGTLHQEHSSIYLKESSRHYDRETAKAADDVTGVADTEGIDRNARAPKLFSPPTLCMVSPGIRPVDRTTTSISPVPTMPVLSPHDKSPPSKTRCPPPAPPPLISFRTQAKATCKVDNKSINRNPNNSISNNNSKQFQSYRQHSAKNNNKTSAFVNGHHIFRHKSEESLRSEYGDYNSVSHTNKDTAGVKVTEHCLSDKNRMIHFTNDSRMNPLQQRILAEYSQTYRQQLFLTGIGAEQRSPQNTFHAENRHNSNVLLDASSLHPKSFFHNGTSNTLPDLNTDKISTPPRSGFHLNSNRDTRSSTKSTHNVHSNVSQENAPFKTNTNRENCMSASVRDAIQEHRHPSGDVPLRNSKLVENFAGSRYPRDNDSRRDTIKDGNPKPDLGNLLLPFMIYGQVLLSGSRSNTNQNDHDKLQVENSMCGKESSVNDWNNTTIDLTESDSGTSEPANDKNVDNCATKISEVCSSNHLENNRDLHFNHDVRTDTNLVNTSVISDSCKNPNGNLEYMSFGKATELMSEASESDQTTTEKISDEHAALGISANDKIDTRKTCSEYAEQINCVSVDNVDDAGQENAQPSPQTELNKTERYIPKLKLNENSNIPITISCQSPYSKGILSTRRLSMKCLTGNKNVCPRWKKIPLSLEGNVKRRNSRIHPCSQVFRSKLLKTESVIDSKAYLTSADGEQTHIDAKVNIENPDAFDFCESESSEHDEARCRSIKRFAGKKRRLNERSDRNESGENSKRPRCNLITGREPLASTHTKAPKDNPKQKKRKKLDVYQQIKAVGRRKRKYQTKKTLSQNEEPDRKPTGERVDGRRARKRYNKNEAYEEELAREEYRKTMLRAKRRQRQQEHDKPNEVTLCAKRRQRQQEDDKPDDVTLCAKRRQLQQEHDKTDEVTLYAKRRHRQQVNDNPPLYPDDVITFKCSLENQEAGNTVHDKIDMIPRKRVGRPPKKMKKCNSLENEVKERRRVGRPRKLKSNFATNSKCTLKICLKERNGFRLFRKHEVKRDFFNTDQLLGNEIVTQEGVSDDVFHLPVYIKGEDKDDSDFADDATIIYDISDSPEVHSSRDDGESLPLSGIRSFPPDLKRLQVNKNVGETVLHRAARLGYEDVIVYCLETGLIDVNVKDHGGYTALHECCVRGNLDAAKRLIAYGANINSSAQDGTRPLHDAVACNRLEMVRFLLSSGADPALATYSGRTCAKIAHTKEMKEFLQGYESDLNGGEAEDVSWDFYSSVVFEAADNQGFDIFGDVPPDDDVINVEPHFDNSSRPHLPAYKLQLEEDEGPSNYLLLRDVLDNMQMNRNEFFNLCGNVSNVTVTCDVFNRHVEHSQLLVSPWQHDLSGNDSKKNIEYVELVRLNDNLRKHLCITKYNLSDELPSKETCELLNDGIVSDVSFSDSVSVDFYRTHNQSRDSYLFPFSDSLDIPDITSEMSCEKNQATNKFATKDQIFPKRNDPVERDAGDASTEFTNWPSEGGESYWEPNSLTTATKTFSHIGGNNTASLSPMKGLTLKLANTTRGCFRDSNVSGSNNPTSDRHRSSPATGEDACTLKVAQECMMRDNIIGSEFQAQQTTHSIQQIHQQLM